MLDAAPPLPVLPAPIGADFRELDDIPVWDGSRFELAYAIDVLYKPPTALAGR